MDLYLAVAIPPKCPGTRTAFLLSAGPLSAVASLGAGFVLAVIVQLFAQRRREALLEADRQRSNVRSTISVTVSVLSSRRRASLASLRKELQERYRRQEDKRSTALTLLYSTLVVLALDGFLYALVSGQENCIIANTEAMIASSVMAVGATSFFCAMAWLLDVYEDHDVGLVKLSKGVAYYFPVSVVFLLGITAVALVSDYYRTYGAAGRHTPLVFEYSGIYVPLITACVAGRALWCRRRNSEDHREDRKKKVAIQASYVAAGYAICSLVLFGVAASIPSFFWHTAIVEWCFLILFITTPVVASTGIIIVFLGTMPIDPKSPRRE